MGSYFLLQGVFLTQGSNLRLLRCRQILYHLSHQATKDKILELSYILHQISNGEILHSHSTVIKTRRWDFLGGPVVTNLFPLQWVKGSILGCPAQPEKKQQTHKPRRLTVVNTMNEAKDFIEFTSVPLMPLF